MSGSSDGKRNSAALGIVGSNAHVDGALTTFIDGRLGCMREVTVCLVHVVGEPFITSMSNTLGYNNLI